MRTSIPFPYLVCLLWLLAADYLTAQVPARACRPPSPTANRVVKSPVTALAGSYTLRLIVERGGKPDTLASGYLTLTATTPGEPPENDDVSFPLWGWADINLDRLGALSFLYPPSSRSRERPGVQVAHRSSDGSLTLVLGNAFTRSGVGEDGGVFLQVLEISNDTFRGRWRDGGRGVVIPSGYFCAWREAANPDSTQGR